MKFSTVIGTILIPFGVAWANLDIMPAARVHVRNVEGVPMRFTSKLTKVVEMNFTLGFHHLGGKQSISGMLDRIAVDYAIEGRNAFAIQRFTGPGSGAANGLPNPTFTLPDLLSAEVIVANNLSMLNLLPEKDPAAAAAFETSVREEGRGVLGFHASAEGSSSRWDFYEQCLNPRQYVMHGSLVPVPVYRDERESGHLALEGVLATGTPMEVPMGVDGAGNEILRKDVVTRSIKNESNIYARDILADSLLGPLTTPLLRYDMRSLGTSDFPRQYRHAGGIPYAFILKAGRGKSGYISAGHEASETTTGATSFDAGIGEFERFYAQMLFFLAGYTAVPCGGSVDCSGLPLVDSADHLVPAASGVAMAYGRPEFFASGRIGFAYAGTAPHRAILADARGKVYASRTGSGNAKVDFDANHLGPGVYFLIVRIGSETPRIKRYAVAGTFGRTDFSDQPD